MNRDERRKSPSPQQEQLALALLTSGQSYADAMKLTGLDFVEVQRIWNARGKSAAAS